MRKLLILLLMFFSVAGCLPDTKETQVTDSKIIHVKIGDQHLYIPEEYVKLRNASIGTEAALLRAWYPGSAVVPDDSADELWRRGIWWRNIAVLISSKPDLNKPTNETISKSIDHLNATKIVGIEYDLTHFTQPEGKVQDHYDVWYEMSNDQIISYITCSEKIIKTDVPQCSHYIWIEPKLRLKISYDRRFLPEWKIIESNVRNLVESFRAEDTAKIFVTKRLKEMQP